MDYKLFDDYITLQALLKEVGIIQSGGAIKAFLSEKQQHQEEQAEKIRVANMVKEMNRNLKKTNIVSTKKNKKQTGVNKKSPVRFPGT